MAAEYTKTCEDLAAFLEFVADAVECGVPLPPLRPTRRQSAHKVMKPNGVSWSWVYKDLGPGPDLVDVSVTLGGCWFKLAALPSAEGLRHRAAELRKTGRALPYGSGNWPKHIAKPGLGRPGFDKRVYKRFIDDDEHENAQAYKDLYQ